MTSPRSVPIDRKSVEKLKAANARADKAEAALAEAQRALTEAQHDRDLVRDLLHDRAVGWQRQAEEAERSLASALSRLKVVERERDESDAVVASYWHAEVAGDQTYPIAAYPMNRKHREAAIARHAQSQEKTG